MTETTAIITSVDSIETLVSTMVPPPGQVWSIEGKAYNCLAYLFTKGKIPETLKAAPVRNAHPSFSPWKPSAHTTNWRTNFNAMRKLASEGKLKWDVEMLSDTDKAEMDGNIATIARKYAAAPAAAGAAAPEAGNEEYTEEDVEGVRAAFGGKFILKFLLIIFEYV